MILRIIVSVINGFVIDNDTYSRLLGNMVF